MKTYIIETNQCYSLKTLEIGGQDLIAAGIPEGENIGRILNKILDDVIDGKLKNERNFLMNYINENKIIIN